MMFLSAVGLKRGDLTLRNICTSTPICFRISVSPFEFFSLKNCAKKTLKLRLFALTARPTAAVVLPLPFPVYMWISPFLMDIIKWSGRRDSNPRLPAWEANTLPLSYARSSVYNNQAMFYKSRCMVNLKE